MKHRIKLIVDMSRDDFKSRYSGSAFGATWAFVQPVVTILLYWFVFEYGLKAASTNPDVPFVVWMMSAMIPYLFFSDAISNVTNSFLQYSYLVKKSVFDISVLPVIKMVSSSVVHIFFVLILTITGILCGVHITMSAFQLIYYYIALSVYILSLAYLVSTVEVFFRDMAQIVSIITQIGMWATPIMWPVSNIPPKIVWIFYLNPIYYITEGYRDAITGSGEFFWDKPAQTLIFLCVLAINIFVSAKTYNNLNKQFAEVL